MFRAMILAAVAFVATTAGAQAACDANQSMMELSTASTSKMMTLPADKQEAIGKAMQEATTAMAAGKNDDACKAIEKAKALLK